MPEWRTADEENAFDLPTFNAYALPYITVIGEYLLTLPQQLEPMAQVASEAMHSYTPSPSPSSPTDAPLPPGEEGGDEAGAAGGEEDAGAYFVREWMHRVAEGASSLYVEQLRAIPRISDRGAQQLSADIEYLSSVLSVLYVPLSLQLGTYQLCLATPREGLKQFVAQEAGSGALDMPTARLFAKARGIEL